jgi:hypothetical protein
VKDIGCGQPSYIPVMVHHEARADTCLANVRRAVDLWGGSLSYGWTLHECPGLWTTAHFHAVRATVSGLLVDETPGGGAPWTLFAPDVRYGPASEFVYPANGRRRIPATLQRDTGVLPHRNSSMLPIREGGFSARMRDPVPQAIDECLETLSEIDALFVWTSYGRRCREPERVSKVFDKVARAQRRLLRLLEANETHGSLA